MEEARRSPVGEWPRGGRESPGGGGALGLPRPVSSSGDARIAAGAPRVLVGRGGGAPPVQRRGEARGARAGEAADGGRGRP